MRQPFIMQEDTLFGNVLDFSFLLDAPAGKYGFVSIKDGHLYTGHRRIRFYGFNIAFESIFMPKERAELTAERLSRAGVNFVRIHGEDARSWAGGDLLITYSEGHSRNFSSEALDKLDYLFHCLKEKGIYMQIDLLVGRGFLQGDGLDYDEVISRFTKQCNVFNRRLIELQKEFAEGYLTHFNPYTGLRLIDDPAVAVIEVMNENSIYWYNGLDEEAKCSYQKELDRRFNHYLMAKYGSRKGLDGAWTKDDGSHALLHWEDSEQGTVSRIPHMDGTQMYVDWKAPYEGLDSPARYADYNEFLTGLQLDFSREMRDHLVSLGVKCPINISNHAQGAADIYSIDKYADVNEDNGYWNHPDPYRREVPHYHGMNMVENDPRQTAVDSPFKLNLVTRLNHDRVVGKPFIASEWNILYGTDFRSDALPMVAAYASLQDWDGMVLYAYFDKEKVDSYKLDGPFNLFNDPATWGQVGLCSYLFQKGLVKPGRNRLEVCYTERDLYAIPRNWITPYGYASYVCQVAAKFIGYRYEGNAEVVLASGNTPTGDYTMARHGLIYARSPYVDGAQKYRGLEGFLHKHGGRGFEILDNGGSMDEDYRTYSHVLDAAMKRWGLLKEEQGLMGDGKLVADTDELEFDFEKGIFRINTPQLKAAYGNIQGVITLGNYRLQVENQRMGLSLLALDGTNTDESKHLLLVALGWCGNLDMEFTEASCGSRILSDAGHGPVSIDSLEGSMEAVESIRIYPLCADGSRMSPLSGETRFRFNGEGTMYFEIVRQ